VSALLAAAMLAAAPSFTFGTVGGNIRPRTASIARSGKVVVDGAPARTISQEKLSALGRLSRRQDFVSLPATVACPGVLPDIASRYVRVTYGGRTRKVTVHGGCNARFNAVYSALARAAGLPA
jgi:hypothetical protein